MNVGDVVGDRTDLWDYRRRVEAIYRRVREGGPGESTWATWARERDDLFLTHPESPIDDRETFKGLPYFEYHPSWRTVARLVPGDEEPWGEFLNVGRLEFQLEGKPLTLPMFWLNAYGGGVFVPFRDRTNGAGTYGGGRYILDTVKGADLGHEGHSVILDFNYAYHPSCVHSDRWTCPLAPTNADLDVAITAGERLVAEE